MLGIFFTERCKSMYIYIYIPRIRKANMNKPKVPFRPRIEWTLEKRRDDCLRSTIDMRVRVTNK